MSHINLDLQASHKMLMMLDEANANTESVINQIPGIFLIINENHEVLRANDGFSTLFGLAPEDNFRLPLARFFRPEYWKIFAHNIQQIIDSPSPEAMLQFEMSMTLEQTREEKSFHWTLTKRPVKNSGEGNLLTVFGDDISGLREAERRLTNIFTSIPLGIFTLNKDGTLGESYSRFLESMLDNHHLAGSPVEEVLFKPALASLDEQAIAGIQSIRDCLGRPVLEFEKFARTFPQEIIHNTTSNPDDGRWLRISYQPIVFDRIVEQLLIILEDRTAIVNAEREMLEATLKREKAIALEKQSLALYESAIRDPLTGLYTRLYMKDAVAALLWSHDHDEIAEASMLILDIDNFKKINDTHGHKNGDLVLTGIARVILRHTRESDIPIRFGGEEFIVFLADAGTEAFALAERIRNAVERMTFDLGEVRIRATVSGGITEHRKGESLEEFMHRADQFLYQAKNCGRNQNRMSG